MGTESTMGCSILRNAKVKEDINLGRARTTAHLYLADRAKGMTYSQIAAKYGVTRQRVGQVCGQKQVSQFRVVTEKGCIYKNLRNWMNENQISRSELLRQLGMEPLSGTLGRMRSYMSGRNNPPKYIIDGMIRVTGLSYEALFEVG